MFDPSSRALLRQAPDLPGLAPETLDELLTAAHIELATVRLLSREGEPEAISDVLDQVRRLASTFEAYVALDLRPEQTRHGFCRRERSSNIEPRSRDRNGSPNRCFK